ncbi:hypothetical protein B3ORF21 [Pseudomonas phage B3]|uniref:Uncharacterized protein n=1 Tax=Pseudomonas phage B3 TaxID=151599 RepID=Q5ZQZ5_9CAUD|nr:hypothetical protein B3ORF21 [Pseudomonas phage B3]AAQ13939.1 hypothetical protein B3ORF21 [Pseudomonas phage B3]
MNNFSKWISAWLLIGCFLNMGGARRQPSVDHSRLVM